MPCALAVDLCWSCMTKYTTTHVITSIGSIQSWRKRHFYYGVRGIKIPLVPKLYIGSGRQADTSAI